MNNDLIDILKAHLETYPHMTYADMIKVIYQNEFAGGHMIKDENAALKRLTHEMDGIDKKGNEALFEPLGNGLCRLNLHALDDIIQLNTINRFFVMTANHRKGEIESYTLKLKMFTEAIKEGVFPYSIEDVLSDLENQKALNYPAMHHSILYNELYQPAYRVVDEIFMSYYFLFERIDELLQSNKSLIIAIDGQCGAGKSSLGNLIQEVYDCTLLRMDDFYLPQERKTEERLNEPGGNVDYERFKKEVLIPLEKNEFIQYQPFDCKLQSLTKPIQLKKTPLVVVEGSYSMHPTLKEHYDLKVFLKVNQNVQLSRILKRNGPEVLKRFETLWIPLENRYFDYYKLENEADFMIDTSDFKLNF